ncbi:hypothetical protein QUB80_02925 [Chlorogloeopsis sp. ULAP01]|uniref:hypothetical protein n=1 Tax=Chlorogloeopsis sp. ULAP01 TaxID=3056483 RepID=UPI0025AA5F52|nr:hypothetical protein [Chlorogloeopsis sp. ULAP01]MDM9379656.1 hypothetical protein [Chlorogloeopsis sp. ULAP01]
MLRLYHVLLGGVLVLLLPLGIKVVSPRLSRTNGMPEQPHASSLASKSNQGNLWKSILDQTASPTGWQVAACDGNTSVLCVSANGKRLGTVEIAVYPLEKQQNFQNLLRQAGIEPGKNIDYQNPQYKTQVSTALNAWVNDYYTFLSKERQGSYGNRIAFSTHPPQQAQVGKLQGLSYGFTGVKVQGGVQEHHLGYVAFDGKNLYVIRTAFNPSLKTGKFERLENLAIFEPYLRAIAANLRLP